MDKTDAPPSRGGIPKWLVPAIGYTLSAVSLIWVLSKFPYAQLGDHLRTMNWAWVGLAVALDVSVYFADAWRWKKILRPAGNPPYWVCVQSILVGVFANDVLPARAGEVIRCFLLSYETEVTLSLAITSDIILRIMDGLWIVILYLLISYEIGSHTVVNRVMIGFGSAVTVASLVILFVLFRKQHAHHFANARGWPARFTNFLENQLEEIHRLGHVPELRMSMLITGLYWLGQVVTIWALAKADAFDFGLSGAAFLLVVKAVITLIPNAPANVGAYQFAVVYALGLMLVERPNAQIFSEIAFWILTVPAAVAGAVALAFTGVDITSLHKHAKQAHADRRQPPGNS